MLDIASDWRAVVAASLGALLGGCGGDPAPARGVTVMIGVAAEPSVELAATRYELVVSAAGEERARTVATPSAARPGVPIEQSVTLDALPVELGATVSAFGAGEGVLVTQSARTRLSAASATGHVLLFPLRLSSVCATNATSACPARQTCAQGRCVDDERLEAELVPFVSGWADDVPDACRAAGAGPGEVLLGTGQTAFHAVNDDDTLALEPGPQGGHHLWIAVRTRNVRQVGTLTTITATQPSTALVVPPTRFVFALEPDEGGACGLHGLRYQIDNASAPVDRFLGRGLEVTVALNDRAGQSVRATRRITIASRLEGSTSGAPAMR